MQVAEVVNVRAERSVKSRRVARLMPGEVVLAKDLEADWYEVAAADAVPDGGRRLGYVYAPLLRPFARPDLGSFAPMAVSETVNIRAGRSIRSRRVGRLAPGAVVLAGDCRDDWFAVAERGADGGATFRGYVYAPLLHPLERTAPPGRLSWRSLPGLGGARVEVTPSVTVRTGYDDNVNFRDVGDFEVSMEPAITVDVLRERTAFSFQGAFSAHAYSEHNEYDKIDHRYSARFDHKVSERLFVNAEGRLASDQSFEYELAETGTVVNDRRRTTISFSPGIRYKLGERSELSLSSEFSNTRRAGKEENNHQSAGLVGDWRRELLDERGAVRIGGSAVRHAYYSGSQDLGRVWAGYERALTELLHASLLAGLFLEETDFSRHGASVEETAAGLTFELSCTKKLETGKATLDFRHAPVPGASGESMVRTQVGARLDYDLSERWTTTLSARHVFSETNNRLKASENMSAILGGGVSYRFTEDATLGLEYEHTAARNLISHSDQSRNRLYLMFAIQFPDEW